jgi:hypothetical protein
VADGHLAALLEIGQHTAGQSRQPISAETDPAVRIDKGAFGGDAPDQIFRGHGLGWCVVDH